MTTRALVRITFDKAKNGWVITARYKDGVEDEWAGDETFVAISDIDVLRVAQSLLIQVAEKTESVQQ